jgi:parallel beta-helix repeat protein
MLKRVCEAVFSALAGASASTLFNQSSWVVPAIWAAGGYLLWFLGDGLIRGKFMGKARRLRMQRDEVSSRNDAFASRIVDRTGIHIEGLKGGSVGSNKVLGYDVGIAVLNSEEIGVSDNDVSQSQGRKPRR